MGQSLQETEDDGWKLVLFVRDLRPLTGEKISQGSKNLNSAHYIGSQSCQKCHAEIYEHWRKTPMANVVRDPREHPDAIIPNLATDSIARFTRDDVAPVYGSLWKQRYFTKKGDDYFPEPAQWDVTHRVWRPYFVAKEQTGGSRFIRRTICSGQRVRPAMDAIPWTMTSTRNRSRNGTSDAKSVTDRVVSTSSIPLAETF